MRWPLHRTMIVLGCALLHAGGVAGCYIAGTDSGYCDTLIATDAQYRSTTLPHCSKWVKYVACLPKYAPLGADRRFPNRRWTNHSATHKDRWIFETGGHIMDTRRAWELNESKPIKDDKKNEFGEKTGLGIIPRFSRYANDNGGDSWDCQNAFRSYFCYINFPRCDQHLNSLLTCKSACMNFFRSCNYEEDLHRCGPSQFFNGYEPEEPAAASDSHPAARGGTFYIRDMFPGQPFRDYNGEYTFCTPSIKGAAPSHRRGGALALAAPIAASMVLMRGMLR